MSQWQYTQSYSHCLLHNISPSWCYTTCTNVRQPGAIILDNGKLRLTAVYFPSRDHECFLKTSIFVGVSPSSVWTKKEKIFLRTTALISNDLTLKLLILYIFAITFSCRTYELSLFQLQDCTSYNLIFCRILDSISGTIWKELEFLYHKNHIHSEM